jgi:hypothetical protein
MPIIDQSLVLMSSAWRRRRGVIFGEWWRQQFLFEVKIDSGERLSPPLAIWKGSIDVLFAYVLSKTSMLELCNKDRRTVVTSCGSLQLYCYLQCTLHLSLPNQMLERINSKLNYFKTISVNWIIIFNNMRGTNSSTISNRKREKIVSSILMGVCNPVYNKKFIW